MTWRLPNGNLPHTGIVSDKVAADGTPLIIHNIGRGTQENILFVSYSQALSLLTTFVVDRFRY